MPFADVRGGRLHYVESGAGDQTVVFSHGFLMNHRMFDHQAAALAERYRVISFEHRGHGESSPVPRGFGMYDLVDDAAALIESLVDGPVHFVGMSTGGYVGMRLALKHRALLQSLTLIDTRGDAEPKSGHRQYKLMLAVLPFIGIGPLMPKSLGLLMGKPFRTDPARKVEFEGWKASIRKLEAASLVAFGQAIFGRDDVLAELARVRVPAIVLTGELDIPTPPESGRALAKALRADWLSIARAGHSSPVESPKAVTAAVTAFLDGLP